MRSMLIIKLGLSRVPVRTGYLRVERERRKTKVRFVIWKIRKGLPLDRVHIAMRLSKDNSHVERTQINAWCKKSTGKGGR